MVWDLREGLPSGAPGQRSTAFCDRAEPEGGGVMSLHLTAAVAVVGLIRRWLLSRRKNGIRSGQQPGGLR